MHAVGPCNCTLVCWHMHAGRLYRPICYSFDQCSVTTKYSGEARGLKVGGGGVKDGTGGGVPLPLGVRGLCPRKNFKLQMHVGEF
jgi:hypothetical protein